MKTNKSAKKQKFREITLVLGPGKLSKQEQFALNDLINGDFGWAEDIILVASESQVTIKAKIKIEDE